MVEWASNYQNLLRKLRYTETVFRVSVYNSRVSRRGPCHPFRTTGVWGMMIFWSDSGHLKKRGATEIAFSPLLPRRTQITAMRTYVLFRSQKQDWKKMWTLLHPFIHSKRRSERRSAHHPVPSFLWETVLASPPLSLRLRIFSCFFLFYLNQCPAPTRTERILQFTPHLAHTHSLQTLPWLTTPLINLLTISCRVWLHTPGPLCPSSYFPPQWSPSNEAARSVLRRTRRCRPHADLPRLWPGELFTNRHHCLHMLSNLTGRFLGSL